MSSENLKSQNTADGKKRHPLTWVPSAYFAMGLPFVALSLASVIMFADLGVDEAQITFWTSLLILPYTLKFLWSPLLEIYFTKKAFVLACQMISGIFFGLIAFILPLPDFFAFTIALMGVIAFSGATNDIATDGIYLTALDDKTQATYIGWQGAFYNLAKVLINGGLVWLAGMLIRHFQHTSPDMANTYAWMVIMGIIALLLIALSIYHFFFLPTGSKSTDAPKDFRAAMKDLLVVFMDFFHKRHIGYFILFIICYRLTEGFAVKMVPLFLKASREIGGLGMTNEEIGLIYGTLGTVAFIVGSILAGYYVANLGLKKAILSLVCIFNIPFVVYYLFALFQPDNIYVIGIGLVAEYFCYGFGFVGLTLFMMQQVAPGKHPMAHYAFASAIMNFGFMIPGMISGWIYQHVGYEMFFLIALFMAIPVFLLTIRLPFTHRQDLKSAETK
ncbi:MAG: MFS transporter [Muribaculaceae bacterium]|jgi:PAT family beta-lactamase induction signal transducer AmpG|nr:MFS transporter [Muribaculaceae bacterium]HUN19835.1 MFS transporter [Muribaculaceae bacterium]